MTEEQGKWKIRGFDTFSDEDYSLPGEWDDEEGARKAAGERLLELAQTQPEAGSLIDKVYVIRPDGTGYRYFGYMSAEEDQQAHTHEIQGVIDQVKRLTKEEFGQNP